MILYHFFGRDRGYDIISSKKGYVCVELGWSGAKEYTKNIEICGFEVHVQGESSISVLYPVHLLVIPMYICASQSLFSHSYVVNE
jgi:hypothetical protein